ncbi:MAG: phosphate ABC transporter substrate-binding protein [Prolixibacteraceae bacterium]|nr:phosphate ABC transporter substrate-binding protein [Burkholderiales bacterium]
MKTSLAFLPVLAAALAFATVTAYAEEVVVIVNKDNPNVVDRQYIARLYTGAVKGWPDGSPAFPVDQIEGSETRAMFYAKVVGKSQATVRALWQQIIFSGNGLPPRIVSPDAAMKRLVATNRNAIGYILSSQVDASVKVIAK